MDWLNVNVLYFQYFILVLTRMLSMIALAPLIGSTVVPVHGKIGLSLCMSMIIFPIAARNFPPIPADMILFFGMMVKEFAVGALLGLMGAILFSAVQLSGQIFGVQLGFGIVNVIDPMSDDQISLLGQFEFLIAILLFMSVNGHHVLISAIMNSYKYIPMNGFRMSAPLNDQIMGLLGKMFVIAYKVGFPMIASVFILNAAMGVIARTVPQMNVFIVGLPLNIYVGLSIMAVSIGFLIMVLIGYFDQFFVDVEKMFRIAGGT